MHAGGEGSIGHRVMPFAIREADGDRLSCAAGPEAWMRRPLTIRFERFKPLLNGDAQRPPGQIQIKPTPAMGINPSFRQLSVF